MSSFRPFALAAAILLAVAAPGSAAGGDPGGAASTADVLRFRSEFGFPTDRSALAAADGGPAVRGLPVTPAEYDNLVRRAELRRRLQPAVDFIKDRATSFGGVYFEQGSGSLVMVVETTAAASDDDKRAVAELLPQDSIVVWRSVEIPLAQLQAVAAAAEAVVADIPNTVQLDARENVVHVRVSAADAAAVRSRLAGMPIDLRTDGLLESAACTSRTVCYLPWRGGTYVASPNESCTWGFNARKQTTLSDSTRYIVTAGHCATLGQNLTHNGSVVNISGGVTTNTYDFSSSTVASDSLRATLKTDSGSRNLIYISSASPSYAITGILHYGGQNQGDAVCMSTVVSGYRCGTITIENFSGGVGRFDGKTKTISHLWETSFAAASGDSGGPVIAQTLPQAWGIVSAVDVSNANHMVYSGIDFVSSDLGIRLCLDSTCS